MAETQLGQETEWAAFPAPKARCPNMPAEEMLALLEHNNEASGNGNLLLVDVRRVDWMGGALMGSVNLPAHSFYPTRAAVYDICKRAGCTRVVFYCGSCSDGGRGWKCSNWFQDYIDEKGDSQMRALTLEGGIKGWVKRFGGRGVEGFDLKCWQ